MWVIRGESADDEAAIRRVTAAAFETPAEAKLVDALRQQAAPIVSLVAQDSRAIVGHILFSPVALSANPGIKVMGLAPMAVVPERQRQGIGTALVCAGLEECREMGVGAVVVLGHPSYYPRFGFRPASRFGLRCEFDVEDSAFMAIELQAGALDRRPGVVRYHPAFGNL